MIKKITLSIFLVLYLSSSLMAQQVLFQLDSVYTTVYSSSIEGMRPSSYTLYEFNEQNLNTSVIGMTYTNDDEWEPSFKYELSYDQANLFNGTSLFYFDAVTQEWINYIEASFVVNEMGHYLNYESNKFLGNGELIPFQRIFFTYNSEGLLSETFVEEYDELSWSWIPNSRTSFSFDNDGNVIKDYYDSWDIDSAEWKPGLYKDHSYESGELVSTVWREGDEDGLRNWRKQEYTFEPGSALTQTTYRNWMSADEEWGAEFFKINYTHDLDTPMEETILPFDISGEEYRAKLITSESSTLEVDQSWRQSIVEKLFYSNIELTGVEHLRELELTVYPNPATDRITLNIPAHVENASLEVFDASGALVLVKELLTTNSVQLTNLMSGNYFYKVVSEEHYASGKFSVIK